MKGESSAQLDRIHAKPIKDVLVDDRELLDRVVHTSRLRGQAQGLTELWVGNRRDSGRPVPGKVDRDSVWLVVIESG
jgi:hypothetical protein